MKYSQSPQIINAIENARKILINMHVRPDCDSVGSAVVFYKALQQRGKEAVLTCPDQVDKSFYFLKQDISVQRFTIGANMPSGFDLLILLDSATWKNVSGSSELSIPPIKKIVIDHHQTNIIEADIRLIDSEASSTAEIIYNLLKDWEISVDANMATCLFSAIADDTVYFRYSQNPYRTFALAAELLARGADKAAYEAHILSNYSFSSLKLLGHLLQNIVQDKGFCYAVVPFTELSRHDRAQEAIKLFANFYLQNTDEMEYGVLFVERSPDLVNVMFRGKGNCNVVQLAQQFQGGGHTNAAGATIKGELSSVVSSVIKRLRHLV